MQLAAKSQNIEGHHLWIRGLDRDGYAAYSIRGYRTTGSYIALVAKLGRRLRPGMMSCHRWSLCHYRHCVNPDHLYEGTPKDNVRDMMEAGRMASFKGHTHPSKGRKRNSLTEEQALDAKFSTDSAGSAARRIGCSVYHVRLIRKGVLWKHLLC